MMLAQDFGKLLRDARRDRGLTQRQTADAAGVSRATLMRLEKGANVGLEDTCKVARALGFTLSLSESIRPTWETAREFFSDGDDDD